jgi:hypothetical protein
MKENLFFNNRLQFKHKTTAEEIAEKSHALEHFFCISESHRKILSKDEKYFNCFAFNFECGKQFCQKRFEAKKLGFSILS